MITLINVTSVSVIILYLFYQLARNEAVYNIRSKWIISGDKRHYNYSYSDMLDPNKNNWFGLRYPRDKHFK